MPRPVWKVSHGSGGFKASYEAVKVWSDGDGYKVKFHTPVGSHDEGRYDRLENALARAVFVARRNGIEVRDPRSSLRDDADVPDDFDFTGGGV